MRRSVLHYTALMLLAAAAAGSDLIQNETGDDGIYFSAFMTGSQEVPPVASPALGTVILRLSPGGDRLDMQVHLFGLDLDGLQTPGNPNDNVIGLHIHVGAVGVNGPVVFGLIEPNNDLENKLLIDAAAGIVFSSWALNEGNLTTLADQLDNLLTGNLYFNVHTPVFPAGEIRGQILLMPDGVIVERANYTDTVDGVVKTEVFVTAPPTAQLAFFNAPPQVDPLTAELSAPDEFPEIPLTNFGENFWASSFPGFLPGIITLRSGLLNPTFIALPLTDQVTVIEAFFDDGVFTVSAVSSDEFIPPVLTLRGHGALVNGRITVAPRAAPPPVAIVTSSAGGRDAMKVITGFSGQDQGAASFFEAEDALLSFGAQVLTTHPGFTGTGFVDYTALFNQSIEWTVNVSTPGRYMLEFRYALESGNRPLRIDVNGSTANASLAFSASGSWATWQTVSMPVNLNAGNNTIRATTIGFEGPNMDHLRVLEIAPPADGIYEAEEALLSGPVILTVHPGFTGTGFVDYTTPSSQFIEWTVTAAQAGPHTLEFRYALESGNRSLRISINGGLLTQGFPATGSWTNWQILTIPAVLNLGLNTVRATTVGFEGPNMDHLRIQPINNPN